MKDITIGLFVIGVIIFGIIIMILASAFGLGRRVGKALVRGKYWLVGVLAGRVRVNFTQLAIFALGAVGAALIAWGDGPARVGFLIALAGQPFWIAATLRARQWGMLALSIWYSGVWAFGAWRVWG